VKRSTLCHLFGRAFDSADVADRVYGQHPGEKALSDDDRVIVAAQMRVCCCICAAASADTLYINLFASRK
jgi:hypothetical protein